MKNATIPLPDDLERWLQVRAAADGRGVSEWIADLLAEAKRRDDAYGVAMKQALAIKPWKMEWVDGRKPTREIAKARREQRRSCVSAGLGHQGSAGNPSVTAGQGAMLFL